MKTDFNANVFLRIIWNFSAKKLFRSFCRLLVEVFPRDKYLPKINNEDTIATESYWSVFTALLNIYDEALFAKIVNG